MLKRAALLIALIILITVFMGPDALPEALIDCENIYEKGIAFFNNGYYQKALEQFEQIGGYEDSSSWRMYCEGFVELTNAGDLEEQGYIKEALVHIVNARRLFSLLAAQEFRDSANMKKYCAAREYQNQKMTQPAIDTYATIAGTLDSWQRYLDLIEGKAYPTQAPHAVRPEKLVCIAAHAVKEITAYQGPGIAYRIQRSVVVNSVTEMSVCGREGEYYYLIEIVTERGRIRCWVPKLYIVRDAAGKETEIKAERTAYLIQTAEGLYGPGEGYLKSDISVPKGAKVTTFIAEENYTMIEYTPPGEGGAVRLWVLTECIGK